jgi:hypothetical protein
MDKILPAPSSMKGTEAEVLLRHEVSLLQRRAAEVWTGSEKQAIIELVRALDVAAVEQFLDSSNTIRNKRSVTNRHIVSGAAFALQPFLPGMRVQGGGVPWGPSTSHARRFMRSYLACSGKLANLLRLAGLERYGLSKTSIIGSNRLVIETSRGFPELEAAIAMDEWRIRRSSIPEPTRKETRRVERMHERMFLYVDNDPIFSIRYDNDNEICSHYLKKAEEFGRNFFESEAFPPDTQIGGRTFGDWKHACDQALGRILCHIDFSIILSKKYNRTEIRDVLTIFGRLDDITAVWIEAGMNPKNVDATVRALGLTGDSLTGWQNSYEVPTPFYVDLGKHFVLLPCFGALTNPYFALFRHLREVYRTDWDRGLDQRERIFREELRFLLQKDSFLVPKSGFRLKRPDGSHITDIDAVIYDNKNGTIALVQLKWHDVFGLSLSERESRRKNLQKASEWIARVHSWIDGRSSSEVAKALGISNNGSDRVPALYVMTRYVSRFSGENSLDNRATWLAWPELLRAVSTYQGQDLIGDLPEILRVKSNIELDVPGLEKEYKFKGLSVELRVQCS